MKKVLLTSVALSGLIASAPAMAADLAAAPYTKAPAAIAAVYDWSGFYIGANGGWGSSRKCWDLNSVVLGVPLTPTFADGCHDASGGTAGGQIGYRWQSASWVFGVEAQGNWANFRGTNPSPFTFGITTNGSKIDAFGLFTGQVGYAWNNMLLYVKGGAAVARDRYDGYIPLLGGINFDTARETRWGGVVGAGLEYGFAPNWSAAIEYDHMFMGNRDVTFVSTGLLAPAGIFSRTERIRQDVDLVTVRVNYRFGGPVVAKF